MAQQGRPALVRAYRVLLRALPAAFRKEAGPEVVEVFEDGLRAAAKRGRVASFRFLARALLDIAVTGWYEWRGSGEEAMDQETGGSEASGRRLRWSRWSPDVKQAFRHVVRKPARGLIGPLTVGVGIGATVLVFVLVRGIVLRPLPFPESDQLVRLTEVDENGRSWWPSYPNLVDWRENGDFLEGVAAASVATVEPLQTGEESVRASVGTLSRGFFEVVRADAQVGRLFTAAENAAGGEAVAVVSWSFWRGVLGSVPLDDVQLGIGGESYTVIGVLNPSFRFLGEAGAWSDASVWVPMERNPPAWRRTSHGYHVVARLRDDVGLSQARIRMNALAERLAAEHGEPTHAMTVRMTRLHDEVVASVRRPLALLLGGALIVFFVACFNLAAMLMADGLSRTRELSVRLALGATRIDLFRNLLSHAAVLAVPGAVLGALFAWSGLAAIRGAGARSFPRLDEVTVDVTLVLLAGGAAALFAIIAGVIPAFVLPAREVEVGLRSHRTATASRGSRGIWSSFVAGQVALTVTLAFACGLLARSFAAALRVDLGYSARNVLTVDIALPESSHAEVARQMAYWQTALDRVRAVPGVGAASLTNILPHETSALVSGTSAENAPEQLRFGGVRLIDSEYFRVMEIPLVTSEATTTWASEPGSVLVDRSLADHLWPGRNAVGHRVHNGFLEGPAVVTGVVGSVKEWDQTDVPYGAVYIDYRAVPERARAMHMVLRTAVPAETVIADVRRVLTDLDPRVPVTIESLESRVRDSLDSRRLLLGITLAFSLSALLLAGIGVYAIVAFVVARGRKESGIRLVLGAPAGRVRRGALSQGLRPALLGLGLGTALTPVAGSLLETQLFRVRSFDPLVLALTIAVLGSAAMIGAWLPARRATRFEPRLVLRDD
jgi:predicted permease